METFRELYEQQNAQFDKENGTVTTHPSIQLEKIQTSEEEDKENEFLMVPNIALLVSTIHYNRNSKLEHLNVVEQGCGADFQKVYLRSRSQNSEKN